MEQKVVDVLEGKLHRKGSKEKNPNKYDLTGKRFGRLVVLQEGKQVESKFHKERTWVCKCDCGNIVTVRQGKLTQGRTKSCGCYRKEVTSKRVTKDLTGKKFGLLTAIEPVGYEGRDGTKEYHVWLCKCDCGNYKLVRSNYLLSGDVKSCGCLVSAGEQEIANILNDLQINYKRQVSFSDLLSDLGNMLLFDFGIYGSFDDLICLIEFQGVQHYSDSDFGRQQREITDPRKREYCHTHNIPLFEIKYNANIQEELMKIINEINLNVNPVLSLEREKCNDHCENK